MTTNEFFYSHKFDYTDKELYSVFLLGDISLVGGYNLSRANHLSNMLREHTVVFINQSIMQSINIYLIAEKSFCLKVGKNNNW